MLNLNREDYCDKVWPPPSSLDMVVLHFEEECSLASDFEPHQNHKTGSNDQTLTIGLIFHLQDMVFHCKHPLPFHGLRIFLQIWNLRNFSHGTSHPHHKILNKVQSWSKVANYRGLFKSFSNIMNYVWRYKCPTLTFFHHTWLLLSL